MTYFAILSIYSFHLCDIEDFNKQISETGEYFPPTYKQDGFIHATLEPRMLIDVANAFYKNSKATWICISLWSHELNDIRYEAPAPVGGVSADAGHGAVKMPHIYGSITKASICRSYTVSRSADGTFQKINW